MVCHSVSEVVKACDKLCLTAEANGVASFGFENTLSTTTSKSEVCCGLSDAIPPSSQETLICLAFKELAEVVSHAVGRLHLDWPGAAQLESSPNWMRAFWS